MEHLLERLGALFVESGVHAPGARRASCEGVESTLVEGVDGVPGSLRAASQIAGYLRRRKSTSTRQKDLAAAQNESVFGAQPGFEPLALPFRQLPNKNWRFQGRNYSPSYTQPSLRMH